MLASDPSNHSVQRSVWVVLGPAQTRVTVPRCATSSKARTQGYYTCMVSDSRHSLPTVRVDALLLISSAVRPGMHVTLFFVAKMISRTLGKRRKIGHGRFGEVSRIFYRAIILAERVVGVWLSTAAAGQVVVVVLVVAGRGYVEGEFSVLEIAFELHAMLLELVALNFEGYPFGSSFHGGIAENEEEQWQGRRQIRTSTQPDASVTCTAFLP